MNTPVTPPPSGSKSQADLTINAEDATPQLAAKTNPQAYPREIPVTPPIPMLSISQLEVAPSRSNGTIPIFFDSDSDSPTTEDHHYNIPAFQHKQRQESPSPAARRRNEAAYALKQKRHASDATSLSDSGYSINSFGIPRQFEKVDPEEKGSRRISIQTTSSSFIHPRPASCLSFASTSTITIDSPSSNLQPLPQVSLSSLTRQQNPSGPIDTTKAAEVTSDKALRTSFVLTYSRSQSFTSLAKLSHGVEHHPFSAAALAADPKPEAETAKNIETSPSTPDENPPSATETVSDTSPTKQTVTITGDRTPPPQAIEFPNPSPSSVIHPNVAAPLPRIRNGSNIPAATIASTVHNSPSYSASYFAQRVSEQYQRELDKEKLDGRLNPSTLRSHSSSAGRLGARFRPRTPSTNTVILSPLMTPSAAVSKDSEVAAAVHGPPLRESSSFPHVQSTALEKKRPWTSAGPAMTKKSSFSLRGRTSDLAASASLITHQKRPMSAQTLEQSRPSTSASMPIVQERSSQEISFFHSITPSSTRSEGPSSDDRATSARDATAIPSPYARLASQEFKDRESYNVRQAPRQPTLVEQSRHNRGGPGGGPHGQGPWPYKALGSDDGSVSSPHPSTSHIEDPGNDGSAAKFARLEASGLGHLGSTVICLSMDQEHFREVMIRFHFNRLTRSPLSPKRPHHSMSTMASGGSSVPLAIRSESSDSSGPLAPSDSVLEFKPTHRQPYAFHYAALDTPPTLRRLHLNDDMKRDYISREGSLGIKNNGVYSLRGTEDKGRILWQFMYFVDDRRNAAGEKMSGEKMVTPLSFTCSPDLLTPERGKKIGLLQVAKKALLPKLGATKLDPPALSRAPPPSKGNQPPEPTVHLVDISNTIERRPPHGRETTLAPRKLSVPSNSVFSRISSAQAQSTTGTGAPGAPPGRAGSLQSTTPITMPSNFSPAQASEPRNSSHADSMTPMVHSPPFTQAFRVELGGSKEDPPEKGLSAISMWDARANAASRPPKPRPVTSHERTSEQSVAVDNMLSPPQQNSNKRRFRVRPATADATASSRPSAPSLPDPRPRLNVLVPNVIFSQSTPTVPASTASAPRLMIPPFDSSPLIPVSPIPDGNSCPGGPIAPPAQIHAWLSSEATPPKTPILSPLSPAHEPPPTILSESGIVNSSSLTDLVPPSPIPPTNKPPPFISPPRRLNRPPGGSSSQPLYTKNTSRPSTAHEIRRKPAPFW